MSEGNCPEMMNNKNELPVPPAPAPDDGKNSNSSSNLFSLSKRKLTPEEFQMYHDLTITDVAQKLNVCPTLVKIKCRQACIPRWPHRKIMEIKRRINAKKKVGLKNARSDSERSQKQLQDIHTKLGELQM